MTTRVLFMCPHAAGKSLLAATYFRAAAARLELAVDIDVAGPDPDAVSMPTVVASLEAQGFTHSWHPRKVQAQDVDAADVVVSVGCNPEDVPIHHTDRAFEQWEVPQLSEDFSGSVNAIHARAEALAARMAG